MLLFEVAFPFVYKARKVEKLYNKVIDKYQHAIPMTDSIGREIQANNQLVNNS